MKKFLLALLLAAPVFAETTVPNVVPNSDFIFSINRLGKKAWDLSLGQVIYEAHNIAVGKWDYSVQGGALGTYKVGITLPPKSVIRNVLFDAVNSVVSTGTTTLAWQAVNANDLMWGVAKQWYYSGFLAGTPTMGTLSSYVKTGTTAQDVKVVLAGSIALAGKVKIFVDYVVSE